MKDINDVIERVVANTGFKEKTVEKVIRSVFADVQRFANKKEGVCIQIPYVGTFRFRVAAIPNYVDKNKASLSHWIGRLFFGQHKQLIKTETIATNNIQSVFYNLKKASLIKEEFIAKHAKYKPGTKEYLESDIDSDPDCIDEYIAMVCQQLFIPETSPFPPEDLR